MTRSLVRRLAMMAALLAALSLPASTASATTYSRSTPMVLQNVSLSDVVNNKRGICHSQFTHVMKNFSGESNARNYMNAAAACGLKVIAYFSPTVDYSKGTVYPSRVAYWVNIVKGYPALWGYLTVKEPSWHHISGSEIRSLYAAYHAADPIHPAMALFGDVPHFGTTANPFTAGMADVVMVDWYPVETAYGGCSMTGMSYITNGPTYFKKIRYKVATRTPGTPVWLMVATHRNLNPSCHKKQRPSEKKLRRQVREGFTYLSAAGIAFHTWSNSAYQLDERRDSTMVYWMKKLAGQVHAGTF